MAVSIRIQHLQWAGGAVSVFGCLILGTTLIASSLGDLRRSDRAAIDLSRFRSITGAADAISAERGPANRAMDPTSSDEAPRSLLAAKRAETDRELARMRESFGREIADSPRLRDRLATLDLALASARAVVDAVATAPPERRDGGAIAQAITTMFAVSDDAASLRDDLAHDLLRTAPQISTEIMLQASASALREETGRLGSYVVMRLTGGLTREQASAAFERTAGRILELWRLLRSYGRAVVDDPAFEPILAAVETEYFGRSWRLAHETIAATGESLTGAEFTRLYVPNLKAPTRVRDSLGAISVRRIERSRAAALGRMLFSGLLTSLVVVVLGTLGFMFRTRLFRPLLAARQQLLAVARGDLSEPGRPRSVGREIGEMFDGLAVLREQLSQKRVLEQEQRRLTRQLRALSETDALTGLLNRRALGERTGRILDEADRQGVPVGLVLFDIDHFKAINDTHGHTAGDVVLGQIGDRMRPMLRPDDLIARYGGEEFLVVLPGCGLQATRDIAERLRRALSAEPAAGGLTVTGSFGIAARNPGSALSWEVLVSLADRGLYRAKDGGRDRVCDAEPEDAPANAA